MSGKKTGMNRVVKWILVGFAAAALAAAVVFVRAKYVLPIVMYHVVVPGGAPNNRLVVSPQTFEKQLAFLKRHGYRVLWLEDAAELMSGRGRRPAGRSLVLTFDDGTEDNYTYMFPILRKYGFPATIFMPVEHIGQPGKLTWEQLKEMQESGLVRVGSHSLSHCFLETIADPQQLAREVLGSKQLLEERLGTEVATFSYPCGRLNAQVRSAVEQAGYRAAVVTNPGKRIPDNDRFALKRIRISENASNMFIFWFEISGYYNLIREHRHK